jgi:hypothetical protein
VNLNLNTTLDLSAHICLIATIPLDAIDISSGSGSHGDFLAFTAAALPMAVHVNVQG